MDLEELTGTQIILLALLVSFVTSIATGIVTVSLLAQAPPAVTQTVNRVVEHTIETVVPKDIGGSVTKETTVVVKEDDLVTSSIAAALARTGRVYSDTSTSSPVIALAVPVSENVFATDGTAVNDSNHALQIGNTTAAFSVSKRFPEIGIALLSPTSTSTSPLTSPFRIADTDSLKLGSTVIALVSIANERVAINSVASHFALAAVAHGDASISVRAIDTEVSDVLAPGAPLVNVFGDLVGVSTSVSKAAGNGAFVSASDIAHLLASPVATSTPQ